jgi:hypothetical protein
MQETNKSDQKLCAKELALDAVIRLVEADAVTIGVVQKDIDDTISIIIEKAKKFEEYLSG